MKKYYPSYYYQNIFTIRYDHLIKKGIKCLLFDLDNTIAEPKQKEPDQKTIDFITHLKQQGFQVIIFSNAFKFRVQRYQKILNVEAYSLACKPLKFQYQKVLKKFNLKPNEIVAIGDQLFTDIKGANKLGISSILITPISSNENFLTKFNRIRENRLYNKMAKEKKLIRGNYDK